MYLCLCLPTIKEGGVHYEQKMRTKQASSNTVAVAMNISQIPSVALALHLKRHASHQVPCFWKSGHAYMIWAKVISQNLDQAKVYVQRDLKNYDSNLGSQKTVTSYYKDNKTNSSAIKEAFCSSSTLTFLLIKIDTFLFPFNTFLFLKCVNCNWSVSSLGSFALGSLLFCHDTGEKESLRKCVSLYSLSFIQCSMKLME